MPLGWLTTIITMNSFGKMVKSKRFLAPCGRFCSSRDDAIKYMMKEGIYTDEELDIMQSGFGVGEEELDDMNTGAWDVDGDVVQITEYRNYVGNVVDDDGEDSDDCDDIVGECDSGDGSGSEVGGYGGDGGVCW